MSDMLVTLTVDQLREVVGDAVKRALIEARPRERRVPSDDPWLSTVAGSKRFKVSRAEWKALVARGALRATVRRVPGGHEAAFVRLSDANKHFYPNA